MTQTLYAYMNERKKKENAQNKQIHRGRNKISVCYSIRGDETKKWLNAYEVSSGNDQNILKLDTGDDWATLVTAKLNKKLYTLTGWILWYVNDSQYSFNTNYEEKLLLNWKFLK
jgi:hypothetical protein